MSAIDTVVGISLFLSSIVASKFLQSRKIVVTEVWVYPIKSCKGYKVNSATTCKRGLKHDREFLLVDAKGKFISQRNYSKMALINVQINESNGKVIFLFPYLYFSFWIDSMTVDAPGMATLTVPLTKCQTNIEVLASVWGQECQTIQVLTDEGNKWFEDYLGAPSVRLVKMKDNFVRRTDEKYAPLGQTSFADGFPFLLASEDSLQYLNQRLPRSITLERFRPNIIVKGAKPFGEDRWTSIRIGLQKAVLNIVKPCSRCQIPNIDPATGIPDEDNQPTKAMKAFRTGDAIGYDNKKWSGAVSPLLFNFNTSIVIIVCSCSLVKMWIMRDRRVSSSVLVMRFMCCLVSMLSCTNTESCIYKPKLLATLYRGI